MKEDPIISIIIPAYNAEKTISETLFSIKNQSFKDFEAIIVNDGSSDDTENIVRSFCISDVRFKLINQKNLGVSAARNTGIDNIKGKWICFIDSDDLISKQYLAHLYESSSEKKIVFTDSICEFEDNVENINLKWDISYSDISSPIKYLLNNKIGVYVWGKLYYSSYIFDNQIRFNTDLSIGEDFEFNIRYLKNIDSINFVSATYFYRVAGNSLSNKFNSDLILERLNAAEYMRKYIYNNYQVELRESDKLYINFGVLGSLRYLLKNKRYSFIYNLVKNVEPRICSLKYLTDLGKKWWLPYIFISLLSTLLN